MGDLYARGKTYASVAQLQDHASLVCRPHTETTDSVYLMSVNN